MKQTVCLPPQVLERVSKILGDTYDGLKGYEIGHYLEQCGIKDSYPGITKWKRIFNALAENQNELKSSTTVLKFIQTIVHPTRFTDKTQFDSLRKDINEALSYVGYELLETGKYRAVAMATTISEAQQRANDLLNTLKARNAHQEIFKYCNAELVDKNYFHAVFEACKGLFERIRQLSCVNTDGTKLVQYVFNHPVLVINAYKSDQEIQEQKGFEAILEGLCNMFRNPEAHKPKVIWPLSGKLSILTYCA